MSVFGFHEKVEKRCAGNGRESPDGRFGKDESEFVRFRSIGTGLVVDEFGALDRLGPVKSTLKVRISESAEDATQLNEKPPVIPWSFGSLDVVLKLGRNAGCGEQTNNREKNARNLSQSPGHGTA